MTPTSPRSEGAESTLSPIPIRLYPLVTAFVRKYVFKPLDVISVPRKEHSREVNLLIGLTDDEGQEKTEHTLGLRSICK